MLTSRKPTVNKWIYKNTMPPAKGDRSFNNWKRKGTPGIEDVLQCEKYL